MFRAKIHRATVTHADLDYEGSITIDEDLLHAADIMEYEAVHIWNVTRGTRLQTYAIRGKSGSGVICVNGAAAHLNCTGDLIIIASFGHMTDEEAKNYCPKVVRVDAQNKLIGCEKEVAGPNQIKPEVGRHRE
jgi:aspartate 1-decarboxylase